MCPLTSKFVMYENQKLKVTGKMVFIHSHEIHRDLWRKNKCVLIFFVKIVIFISHMYWKIHHEACDCKLLNKLDLIFTGYIKFVGWLLYD